MTNQERSDEIKSLAAKRQKLTLINIAGIIAILISQFVLLNFVPMDIMIFYPLLMLAWGAVLVTLIIRANIKIGRLCTEITTEIRERSNVREP